MTVVLAVAPLAGDEMGLEPPDMNLTSIKGPESPACRLQALAVAVDTLDNPHLVV
jgi:hypothetical protein